MAPQQGQISPGSLQNFALPNNCMISLVQQLWTHVDLWIILHLQKLEASNSNHPPGMKLLHTDGCFSSRLRFDQLIKLAIIQTWSRRHSSFVGLLPIQQKKNSSNVSMDGFIVFHQPTIGWPSTALFPHRTVFLLHSGFAGSLAQCQAPD